MPDRVIYIQSGHFTVATDWEMYFSAIVNNIKTKFPSVRRIDLGPQTCAPHNMNCPGVTGGTETVLSPSVFEAVNAMPAKFPGLVYALPEFDIPMCSDFGGNGSAPQYTAAGAMDVAKMFAAYFQSHD
jgi:hypothetical protein